MAEKNKVSANPNMVEFPRDPYQSTQQLRAVGLKASARVGTQKDKLEVYIKTLDVLKEHAVEAFKKRRGIERQTQEAAAKRAAEEARINENRRQAEITQLEAQLAALTSDYADKGEADKEDA